MSPVLVNIVYHIGVSATPPSSDPAKPHALRLRNVLALWLRWRLQAVARGEAGTDRAFARLVGLSPSQWSQHKAGKPLGEKLARQIETALEVETGWLDVPHPEPDGAPGPAPRPGELELLGEDSVRLLREMMGPGASLVMPRLEFNTPAGFPSPAADFQHERVDLVEHMGLDRPHTFIARVRGVSMTGKGIDDGDLIVVNRKLTPRHGHTVVAVIDNELTVKTLYRHRGVTRLVAANPDYPDIALKEGQTLEIWGVVTTTIKKMAY